VQLSTHAEAIKLKRYWEVVLWVVQEMNDIFDFRNIDGCKADLVCHRCRERICDITYRSYTGLAQMWYSKAKYSYHIRSEEDRNCLDHIRDCRLCSDWVKWSIPEDIRIRFDRMRLYCCSTMYCSNEEGNLHKNLPVFSNHLCPIDGTPHWCIDGKRSGANFCPWCGTRLPLEHFTE